MAQPQGPHGLISEPASEHGPGFPPFQSETFASQLLWLALAFGLLYYLMSRVALPRIAAILHERSTRLSSDLDEAHRLKNEADAAGLAYEASLRDARAKAKTIAEATRVSLAADAETRRKALEGDLAARLEASQEALRARTAAAMGSVREIAAEAAGAIVERLTGQAPNPASLAAAADRTLARPH